MLKLHLIHCRFAELKAGAISDKVISSVPGHRIVILMLLFWKLCQFRSPHDARVHSAVLHEYLVMDCWKCATFVESVYLISQNYSVDKLAHTVLDNQYFCTIRVH